MFGIVSDESFTKQLAELEKPKAQSKIVSIERGRGEKKEVPTELKKVIAEEAIQGTPARDLSELFKVSPSSISAYKNDATSTASYNQPNTELKESNDRVREVILDGARGKILLALESITPEKISETKARDAAGIAKDMSAIIKNLEPNRDEGGSRLNQQFIFYAPKAKQESDFEVIEARE